MIAGPADHARLDHGAGVRRPRRPGRSMRVIAQSAWSGADALEREAVALEKGIRVVAERHQSPTRRVRTWPPPRSRQSARCSSSCPGAGSASGRGLHHPGAQDRRPRRGRSDRRRARRTGATAGPRRRRRGPPSRWTKSTASPSPASSSRMSAWRALAGEAVGQVEHEGLVVQVLLEPGQRGAHRRHRPSARARSRSKPQPALGHRSALCADSPSGASTATSRRPPASSHSSACSSSGRLASGSRGGGASSPRTKERCPGAE